MSANYFVKILWSLDFTDFTGIFHLLSHSIFLIWPHFYDKSLEKYIRLIFLPHFTTTASVLYHSRYGFWQVHFRHLVLHMRLLCNMIVDIHCDLCISMAPHILHSFGIDIVLTQSGTSRMTKSMRWNGRHQLRLSLLFFCQFAFFLIIGIDNIFQKAVHSRRHDWTSMLCIEDESTASSYTTLLCKPSIRFSSLCLRNASYTICVIGMSLIPASVLVSESWKQYPSSPWDY